jgi:predicted alpha-1,6-mannanase (GH76 family)
LERPTIAATPWRQQQQQQAVPVSAPVMAMMMTTMMGLEHSLRWLLLAQ